MRIKGFIIPGRLVLAILLLLFTSFPGAMGEEGNIVTDQAGRKVMIPEGVESVVSLSPANTEILFAIGAGKKVAGVTEFCNYPPAALRLPRVGGFAEVNREKIATLSPDLILASHYHISKVVPALEHLGFPVLVINPVDVQGVFSSILFIGEVCGEEKKAGILVAGLQQQYRELTVTIKGKKKITVFWELSEDLWTIGKGSYLDDLITKAGGKNIAGELDAPWLQLSSEFILNANPDIIFLADHPHGIKAEKVTQRPGWDSLSAVTNGRIVNVSPKMNDIVSRPGPRVVRALEYISEHLYPVHE